MSRRHGHLPLLRPGQMNRNSYLKVDAHGERHTPLFRCDELVQEVRSVENAPTWRSRRQHHPHWHICCPYSNRPRGNGCGQGSCCRDDSSGLSCSLATDYRRQDSDHRGLRRWPTSTLSFADPLARFFGKRGPRSKFGSWGFTCEDVTNLFEPRYLGIDLLQYFWNLHAHQV
jgi:hypothetical protein